MEKNQQYNNKIISKYSNNILRLVLATVIVCCLLAQGRAQQNNELFIGGELYIEQGASIYVWGDLHINSASGKLNNDGMVLLEGDLYKTNNALYTDLGMGTLVFDDQHTPTTQGQSVNGDFTGANAIGNLKVSSPILGSLFKLKSGNLEVTNSLQLTNVVVRTDEFGHDEDGSLYANELYINNPDPNALQILGNPSVTHIEGKLRREISAGNTYNFNIGLGINRPEPFELSFHTTPQDFNVLTYFQNQQNDAVDLTTNCNGINYESSRSTGRWVTTPSRTTGYTYDVTLLPGTDLMNEHGVADNIIAEGGTLTQSCPEATTLEADNLSSLSYFDIVGVSQSLAIELKRIWAEVAGKNINVYWATASETDNMGFDLERSTDATNFERIDWVEGQGNSSISTDYKYIDTNVNKDIIYYYRIKAIETSGKYEYSPIVSASLGGNAVGVQVFPNPIRQQNENLSLVAITDGDLQIQIFNEAGQLMLSRNFSGLKGEIIQFAMPQLAAGMHLVTMTNGEYIKRTKLIVTP